MMILLRITVLITFYVGFLFTKKVIIAYKT